MASYFRVVTGMVLLALVLTINIAGAADVIQADLNVSKAVSSSGPYAIDDEVTWAITLRNDGPANATNITLLEDVSQLQGLKNLTAVADLGIYNTTTNLWSIDELKNATSATLTLKTNFTAAGIKTNRITITGLNETDPLPGNNQAEATAQINVPDIIPPLRTKADLTVTKTVSSTGPYNIGDEVTWLVTLRNNGPGNATNITLREDVSHLYSLGNLTAVADRGIYNTTTNAWDIDGLLNGSSATVTLKTTFNTSGNKINKIDITALDETDPILTNNHARATVQYNTSRTINPEVPLSANLIIKPTTLNLNSKGIFTVYVSLTGAGIKSLDDENKKSRIDYANSSLTCDGADMVRATVSSRDGGTLIAKFHRDDLENVTSGDGVQINCSGTLSVNGAEVPVEGSDSIRVTGEKKGLDNILSRLWKFLGIEKEDVEITEGEDGNITVTLSLDPDNFKNLGQAKKMIKNKAYESGTGSVNETIVSDQTSGGKENPSKNNRETNKIKRNNADDKSDKGNEGSDKRDDVSPGKSNGKKNK